jgi:diguanylate cyclase (GGDEF)-like protein
LDHFKKINDFYGHMMGDLVLKNFASTLKKQLRGYDVLGRIGGEEFTALLPGVGEREAYGIAQRVRSSVEGTAVNHTIKYTVSIGVSTLVTNENTTIDHLYRLGDHALYQAKQNGRNQVCAAKAD